MEAPAAHIQLDPILHQRLLHVSDSTSALAHDVRHTSTTVRSTIKRLDKRLDTLADDLHRQVEYSQRVMKQADHALWWLTVVLQLAALFLCFILLHYIFTRRFQKRNVNSKKKEEMYRYGSRTYPIVEGPKKGKYIIVNVQGERKKRYLSQMKGEKKSETKETKEESKEAKTQDVRINWPEIESERAKTEEWTIPYAWILERARRPTPAELKHNLERFQKITGKKNLRLEEIDQEARDLKYIGQGANMRVYDLGNNIVLKSPYGRGADKEMNTMARDYANEPWFFAKSLIVSVPELGGHVLLQEKLELKPSVSLEERRTYILKQIKARPELYKTMTRAAVEDLATFQTGRNQQGEPRIYDYW